MSWDSYIDNLLATKNCVQAAVCGLDGSVWSCSPDMKLNPAEIQTIVSGLKNATVLQGSGIRVGGKKYFYLQSDTNTAQGKSGAMGVSIAKSNMCVLIAVYGEGQQPGNCRTSVEGMRDFLLQSNY